ncbi:NAD(P)/FAD-dependent oxidoreductase [Allosaccharopolyspora coralli]|uniref:NAD(P)/FAD-dependent oxidoreductase n=2 Tax=Allosaccharopolyspora coralli TaxID=2665642 RepID=A0A5Q3QDN4_9PSEU|nr:NAD(P)/FAD-dependent oxidoreductase [Allosaccharopolyspora coralli]
MPAYLVIGGGLAGAKTAEALRARGVDGPVILLCEEQRLPYERPPLSKDYLAGNGTPDDFTVHTGQWYDEHDVDVQLGVRADAVNTGSHEVVLADGSVLGYDKLVLATGSRPRRLHVPGTDARGVHFLRRVADTDRLRSSWDSASAVVVIGGGWIGLEAAAVARGRGLPVTVVEAASAPLLGPLGPRMASVFAELHRDHGVDLRTDATVEEIITDDGAVTGVRLGDGEVSADCVLVAVGARPETLLAERAGLDVEDGVLVDAHLTTSDPDVLAVGDIANVQHPVLGTRVRVEHWATALNQPAVAAANALGDRTEYTDLPFFFSDQYDLGMEYRGHVPPGAAYEVVVRGAERAREFVAFWQDSTSRVLAGMNVNVWDAGEAVERLIRSGKPVPAETLADPEVDLDGLAG